MTKETEERIARLENALTTYIEEGKAERSELRQTMGRLAEVVAGLGIIISPIVSEGSPPGNPSASTAAAD